MDSIAFYFVTYLLVVVNCDDKISINVTVASTQGGANISTKGADFKIISDREVILYNITDRNLKLAIQKELGLQPDEVFLKDPTYYGNIFQKYKWKEVNRKLDIKSAIIDEIINENVVLKVHRHINNTTAKSKIKIRSYEPVDLTITSYWSKDGYHNDDIYYDVNIDYYRKTFKFKNKWRENKFKTVGTIFGMKNVGYINIDPGKSVVTKLLAKKTIVLVKIIYSAKLIGSVFANYARLYGKYHFWSPSVTDLMKAGNLTNEFLTTEYIEVKCYTDPVIDVFDNDTGKKIPMILLNNPFRQRKHKHP